MLLNMHIMTEKPEDRQYIIILIHLYTT